MSGRDAPLTFIDVDKNKILAVPNEMIPGITNCLVLDQNIKVLQSDNLFVKESDVLEFEAKSNDIIDNHKNSKKSLESSLTINDTERVHDGRQEIVSSYSILSEENGRNPTWSELMDFMAGLPNVEATYYGKRVYVLTIEGGKRLDREAFSKRFRRYFVKQDVKKDIS